MDRREQSHPPDEDQGEEEVELLFDGQRPEVPEERWSGEGLEVGLLAEDHDPVGGVGQGAEYVLIEAEQGIPGEEEGTGDGENQEHAERRKESPCPP